MGDKWWRQGGERRMQRGNEGDVNDKEKAIRAEDNKVAILTQFNLHFRQVCVKV